MLFLHNYRFYELDESAGDLQQQKSDFGFVVERESF
jgi:hypothetical protein